MLAPAIPTGTKSLVGRDAREMVASHGPKARDAVLEKAAAFGKRHFKEAAWLSRVAARIGELQPSTGFDTQQELNDLPTGVALLQPSNYAGPEGDLTSRGMGEQDRRAADRPLRSRADFVVGDR